MNIPLGDITKYQYAFPIVIGISLVIALIVALILKKKDML
jgi:energy-converting hydrogenase Eha subunit H